MNYSDVYNNVKSIVLNRKGMHNIPEVISESIIRDLTGLFCHIGFKNSISTDETINFLERVNNHKIKSVITDGSFQDVSQLIDDDITEHKLYNLTENALMFLRPGSLQIGPGEFFFCFYSKCSEFGYETTSGFDIAINNKTFEFKKLNSNFTSPRLFDKYTQDDRLDNLLVIHPVSSARKPLKRSKYSCINLKQTPWRDVYFHRGTAGTLALK